MINVAIGAKYQDAEGEWEVVGIDNGMVEVECIQEGNINYGKRFMVPELEAIIGYYGWEQIEEMMDDEIREELHNEMAPCEAIDFLKAYLEAHREKFGEDFEM